MGKPDDSKRMFIFLAGRADKRGRFADYLRS
jgi:hypothetical protein